MFCWLYFVLPLSSVKNLKQKVFLDQFCLRLSKWSVCALCQNDDNEDSKKVKQKHSWLERRIKRVVQMN